MDTEERGCTSGRGSERWPGPNALAVLPMGEEKVWFQEVIVRRSGRSQGLKEELNTGNSMIMMLCIPLGNVGGPIVPPNWYTL